MLRLPLRSAVLIQIVQHMRFGQVEHADGFRYLIDDL